MPTTAVVTMLAVAIMDVIMVILVEPGDGSNCSSVADDDSAGVSGFCGVYSGDESPTTVAGTDGAPGMPSSRRYLTPW